MSRRKRAHDTAPEQAKSPRAGEHTTRGKERDPVATESPAEGQAGHNLVGSEVLDSVGTGGIARRAMHDIIHSSDDEIVRHHLGPGQEASASFRPDPEVGDAGADLADDFGRAYLQSATTGEDLNEIESELENEPPPSDEEEEGMMTETYGPTQDTEDTEAMLSVRKSRAKRAKL